MPRRPPASTRDPGGALILAAVADAGIRVRHRVLTDADAASATAANRGRYHRRRSQIVAEFQARHEAMLRAAGRR